MATSDGTTSESGVAHRMLMLLGILLWYPIAIATYNIYFHPLSKYPGPKLWTAFRSSYVVSLWKGSLAHDIYNIHQRYGEVVRVAPDEISCAKGEAWQDIYCHRVGHKPFPKNPIWWGELPGRAPSIVSAPTPAGHERMRKLLNHCFSMKALMAEEHTIQSYADLLISQLTKRIDPGKEGEGTIVNIVDWYMYTTFDIVGDLGFGEPFRCLASSAYHPWVAAIFSYFKIGALAASVRFYPMLNSALFKMMPRSAMREADDMYKWSVEKTHRRMEMDTDRDDFMSHILKNNKEDKSMSIAEIENNSNVLIVSGSETCGTVLAGTTNMLIKNPVILAKLTEEIRTSFSRMEDITFTALAEQTYLNAVIQEGLRMCPPVPSGLQHVVPKGGDTVCGNWFPEGTNISVHQWSLYRSPHFFHDAHSFRPERWLPTAVFDPASPFHKDHREAVQAFSVGTWSCIGQNLGWAELRLVIAKMVWNFDMTLPEGGRNVEWEQQKAYVLMEKEPFDVRLKSVRL